MAAQNPSDFMQMQKEAEKRVMEMQRRAKSRIEPREPVISEKPIQPVHNHPKPVVKHSFLDMLNIKSFFESKDTSLVLMVLALLNAEETDPLLMLALLYVIL
ncbi:MAG: hypothetical protein IKM39_04970 [Clostridia bacterium]|nr:hypothetical protein [Clostridia bacterium]